MARAFLLLEALAGEERRVEFLERARLRRHLRDHAMPKALRDSEFKAHYRLSKSLFFQLCHDLRPHMSAKQRTTKVNLECKVLTALSFFATGSYQKPVGMSFLHGLSQPSVSKAIKEVTNALNSNSMQNADHITIVPTADLSNVCHINTIDEKSNHRVSCWFFSTGRAFRTSGRLSDVSKALVKS